MVHDFTGFERGVIGRKMYSDKTLNNMRKEDLIKLLHTAEHNYETLNWFYANAVRYNEKNIPIPKWIPCSERLPEESGYYLAYIKDKDTGDCNIQQDWFAHSDDYYGGSEWIEVCNYEEVIAWMPLPELYKESD